MPIRAVVFDIGGMLELGIHAILCRETEQAIADVQACLLAHA